MPDNQRPANETRRLIERAARNVARKRGFTSQEEINDFCEDVEFKVNVKIHTYKPEIAKFSTWVTTIANHHATDVRRRRTPAMSSLGDTEGQVPARSHNPYKLLSLKEQIETVERVVSSLPETDRKIWEHYAEGKSYVEIAEASGVRKEKLGGKIYKMKRRFRMALRGNKERG